MAPPLKSKKKRMPKKAAPMPFPPVAAGMGIGGPMPPVTPVPPARVPPPRKKKAAKKKVMKGGY
jgi:hypothetical protein